MQSDELPPSDFVKYPEDSFELDRSKVSRRVGELSRELSRLPASDKQILLLSESPPLDENDEIRFLCLVKESLMGSSTSAGSFIGSNVNMLEEPFLGMAAVTNAFIHCTRSRAFLQSNAIDVVLLL